MKLYLCNIGAGSIFAVCKKYLLMSLILHSKYEKIDQTIGKGKVSKIDFEYTELSDG